MRIAMIGTRGLPARYGGFETCVAEVGSRLADAGHEVTVYCRTVNSTADDRPLTLDGMRLVHLPGLAGKIAETPSHTAVSVAHLQLHPVDVAIVFNSANAPFLPAIRARGIPVITHVDGLEWQRAKWGPWGRRYYRMAEALAVRWSDALIADARGIQDYYTAAFGARTEYLAYGAPILDDAGTERLAEVGLSAGSYHLAVARFEPENNLDIIIGGYLASPSREPLVVVGSAPHAAAYTQSLHGLVGDDDRVRFLGGVWDQELLDQLYAHAITYLHGHSVGGTNPSLLRAIGAAAPTIAWDVSFNREVLGADGRYFSNPLEVAAALVEAEENLPRNAARGLALQEAARRFTWDGVAAGYEKLCNAVLAVGARTVRPSGRRRPTQWLPTAAMPTPAMPTPAMSTPRLLPTRPVPVSPDGLVSSHIPATEHEHLITVAAGKPVAEDVTAA